MASVILSVLFSSIIAKAMSVSHSDTLRLHTDTFANYSKDIRPMKNQSEAIVLWFDMHFINIQELDMLTQLLTSSGWYTLIWRDEFLTWDPSEYNGLAEMYVDQDRVWLPRLCFYNTKTTSQGRVIGSHSKMMVRVLSSGDVEWEPDFSLESTCKVDITHFPFDTQQCEIQFISWTVKNTALKIRRRNQDSDFMTFALENGEFSAHGFTCQMGDWSIDRVKCGLKLTRRVNFYIFSLLIPLVLLSIMSLVGFVVPAESGEKLTISMTTLLSFTVYLGVIDSIMPKTSDNVSILMIYVTLLMGISLLSVIGNATVLHLHYRYGDQPGSQTAGMETGKSHLSPALRGMQSDGEESSAANGGDSLTSCLFLIWKKLTRKRIYATSTKRPNRAAMSRIVNKIFLILLSIILFLTMVCIAALFKYY